MAEFYHYGLGGLGMMTMAAFLTPAAQFNDIALSVNFPLAYVEKAALSGKAAPWGFEKTSASSGRVTFERKVDEVNSLTFNGQIREDAMAPFRNGRMRITFEKGQPINVTIASPSESTSINVRIAMTAGAKKAETLLVPTISFTPGGISTEKKKDIESYLSVINQKVAEEMAGALRGGVVQSI